MPAQIKKIKILGKTYKYTNKPQLSKQLNFSSDIKENRDITNQVIKNIEKPKLIYDSISGDVEKLDLREKRSLFLMRRFLGIGKVTKRLRDAILPHNNTFEIDNGVIGIVDENQADNLEIRYSYTCNVYFRTSQYITDKPRTVRGTFRGTKDELIQDMYDRCHAYVLRIIRDPVYDENLDEDDSWKYTVIKVTSNANELDINDMILRDVSPLDISVNIYNDIIKVGNIGGDNCVRTYLKKIYCKSGKGISSNTIDAYIPEDGATTNQIYEFCREYKIKMIAFDINGKIIKYYYPTDIQKSYKRLIYIAYNNHIYPVKNEELSNKKIKVIKNKRYHSQEDINNEFSRLLLEGIVPAGIKLNGALDKDNTDNNIKCFVHEETLHFYNSDYDLVSKLLSKFGLLDKIRDENPLINRYNIMTYIEPLYTKENISSFAPEFKNIKIKGGYNYCDGNDYSKRDVYSVDGNKFYASCLCKLPYLIVCDTRKDKIINNPVIDDIVDHYQYVVQPLDEYSYLLDETTLVTGYYLKDIIKVHGKEKINILYCIESRKVDNYLKKMIEDIYSYKDLDIEFCKDLVNIYIGKMALGNCEINKYSRIENIIRSGEKKYYDSYVHEYNESYSFLTSETSKVSLYTKFPIHCQILDQSRKELYNVINMLRKLGCSIIQVVTDAISFYCKNFNKNKLQPILSSNDRDLGKWKYIKYEKSSKQIYCDDDEEVGERRGEDLDIYKNDIIDNKNNILVNSPAGSGKTYQIINNVIPKLDESYVVVTPSNKSLESYRKINMNSNVIQYYSMRNDVPEENIIIVDEKGMVGKKCLDILIKSAILGKKIISYGDYDQFSPVEESSKEGKPYNAHAFLKLLYGKTEYLRGNMRNNFTEEYYKKLKESTDVEYLIKEMERHSTIKYYDAEYIICYRNKTVDKYNSLILESLNKELCDKGVRVICKTNKLSEKNIYNNFILTIEDNDGEKVRFNNGIEISIKDVKKYFKPAYALTLHCLQGSSVLSYYFAKDDIKTVMEKSDINRYAYTLISRLRTKNVDDIEDFLDKNNTKKIYGRIRDPLKYKKKYESVSKRMSYDEVGKYLSTLRKGESEKMIEYMISLRKENKEQSYVIDSQLKEKFDIKLKEITEYVNKEIKNMEDNMKEIYDIIYKNI